MSVIFLAVGFLIVYVDALQIHQQAVAQQQAINKSRFVKIVKKDKITGSLYVGDGSHVRVFDTSMREIHTHDLTENGTDIKILEPIHWNGSQYLLVCLKGGKFGQCCLIDIQSNRTYSVNTHKNIGELLNGPLTIDSILMEPNVQLSAVYMCLSFDMFHKDYKTHLIQVAELLLFNETIRLLPNGTGSYSIPHAYGNFSISTRFYYQNSVFFLIKRTDIQSDSFQGSEASILVQVNHTYARDITFVTIPLGHLSYPIQITGTLFCSKRLGDYLVVVNKLLKKPFMMVQHVSMAMVMKHINWATQDYVIAVNSSIAGNTRDILKSTSVLELEMSPWHHKSPDYPIDSFLVVSRLGNTYAYYTTSIGGDTKEIHKMKLGNNSNHLPWKEKVDVGNILDTWTNGTTLYIVGDKKIVTLDTAGCNHPTVSDCYHDNECTWCGELPGSCTKKHNCLHPGNMDKLGDFEVTSISPKFGFSCGGSVVRITGRNLDMPTNISVTIGGQNCDVISELSTKTKIEVRVPSRRVHDVINTKAIVVVPKGKDVDEDFKYLKCPKITESPNEINLIGSGGNTIEIFVGNIENINITEFHLVEVAFLHADVVVATVPLSKVKLKDIHTLGFIAPPLNDYIGRELKLGLAAPTYHLLDIPNSRTILYGHLSNLNVNVHKDPVIYGIATGSDTTYIKEYDHGDRNGEIIFTGKYLEKIQNNDVSVDILLLGPCTNVNINRATNRLSCNPPWPKRMNLRKLTYPIVIKIGRNLIYHPGEVKFIKGDSKTPNMYDTVTPSKTEIITITDKPVIQDPQPSIENSNSQVFEIAIPVTVGIVLLLVICCACVCYIFRKYKGRREPVDRELPSIVSYRSNHGVFIGESRPSFQAISAENSSTDAFITEHYDDSAQLIINTMDEEGLLLKKRDLNIDMLIGRGNFGSVFKGHLCNKNERMEIAVKTLQRDKPENMDITQFLKEAFVMKNFQHNNVMTLVGVCLDAGDMPLVVLPYMKHGDLLAYLQEETHIPTVKDLVCFGLGIAQGMEYLASLKFVHRDLAARNCMLDVNYKVKVADFGLSRDVYEASYYSTQSKGIKLPVKWMSIESLSGGVFNEKTDVWSFGITLWELMTRGVRPYAAVDNWDMEAYLKSGRRLPQPMYCPANLYKLMRKCWSQEPEDRPTFTIVKDWISELLNRVHHHLGDMESTTNIENTYVNLGKGNQCIYENLANF